MAIKSERVDEAGMTIFFEYWVYWTLYTRYPDKFVKPIGFAKERDYWAIIIDFAGESLHSKIISIRQDLNLYVSVSIQLLDIFKILHENRIVHRDVKPQNILVRDGQVRLIDFGVATMFNRQNKELESATPGHFVGTVTFAPRGSHLT